MLNTVWKTLLAWASAHPMLAAILLSTMVAGALSSVWYAVRKAVWPGVETARLPTWARVVQALVELMANVPGALRALASWPSTPPGTSAPAAPPAGRTTTVPPPPAALVLLALVGLGGVLQGCPSVIREPALVPPPNGCDAGATLCHQGAPWRCGPEGRWSQADRRCDRLGTPTTAVLCCSTPSALRPGVLVHACVPTASCVPEVSQ